MSYRTLTEMIRDAFNNDKLSHVIGGVRYFHLTTTRTKNKADEYKKELHKRGYRCAITQRTGTKLYVVHVARK